MTRRASLKSDLLPCHEVARRWRAISGERIGKSMVQKIERKAMRKVRAALAAIADEAFGKSSAGRGGE